jgi:CDP-diacylglycerol--serine O-phosphatidyltransferase
MPYYSFKTVRLNRRQAFYATAGIVVLFAAIAAEPTLILPVFFLAYALSGPVLWVVKPRHRKRPPHEPRSETPAAEG